MQPKLPVSKWAEEDRPREKLMQKGVNALSDAELLAILINSGNSDLSSVDLCKRILSSVGNDLNELGKVPVVHLISNFKGIGKAKAITIIAALELGKRRKAPLVFCKTQIACSSEIYNLFHSLLCDLMNEEFWALFLNRRNSIMDKVKISQGGVSETSVDTRILFREAIIRSASGMVLCHNHPSGNPFPSKQDDALTSRIREGANLFNIKLIDHVIVCDGSYYSYADQGAL